MIFLQNDLLQHQEPLVYFILAIVAMAGAVGILWKSNQSANAKREAREEEDRKYNREQQEKVHGALERIENDYQERFAKVLESTAAASNEFVGVKKDIEHMKADIKELKSK